VDVSNSENLFLLLTLPANTEPGLCNVRESVRPSVCLSHRSTAAKAASRFAAERSAGRRCRSIAAGALWTRRRSATNAGSVTLRADGRGSTQICYLCFLSVRSQHIISAVSSTSPRPLYAEAVSYCCRPGRARGDDDGCVVLSIAG